MLDKARRCPWSIFDWLTPRQARKFHGTTAAPARCRRQVRGSPVRTTAATTFTDDGWLRTGDVGVCDAFGSLLLVDRTKDLVKSGGEWISSVQLENEIMAHPKVAEAAVIAVKHEKWVERPLACVVVKPGSSVTAEEIIAHLSTRVAKWWLPDAVEFIDSVPKTSVGKFSKKTLRSQFEDYRFPARPPAPTTAGKGGHDNAGT